MLTTRRILKRACMAASISALVLVAACEKQQEEKEAPVLGLTVTTVNVPSEGGAASLSYTLSNPVEGARIEAVSDQEWIGDFDYSVEGTVSFSVDANEDTESRKANITVRYSEGADNTGVVSVVQQGTEVPPVPIAIAITEVKIATVNVSFEPEDKDAPYFFNYVSNDIYEEYGGTVEGLLEFYFSMLDKICEENGVSREELIGSLKAVGSGSINQTYRNLSAETDYRIYAFHIDAAGEPLSEVVIEEFSTVAREYTGLTIDFDIQKLYPISATIEAVPSSDTETYYWHICTQTVYDSYDSNEEFMLNIIATNSANIDLTATQGPWSKAFTLNPATDYVAFGFGYRDDTWSSELQSLQFRTPDPGPGSELNVDISAEANIFHANVEYIPDDKTVLFYFDIIPDPVWQQYGGTLSGLQEFFNDALAELEALYPQYTKAKIIELIQKRGDRKSTFHYLDDNTKHYAWAVAIDSEGAFCKQPDMVEFTTREYVAAAVTSNAYFDKYWDGDEIIANVSPQFHTMRGKAVCPVLISRSGNVVNWYYALLEGDLTDEGEHPDKPLIQYLINRGYKNTTNDSSFMGVPYNTTMSMVSVAEDADGNYGKVTRNAYTLTKEGASPIADWPYDRFGAPASPATYKGALKSNPAVDRMRRMIEEQ